MGHARQAPAGRPGHPFRKTALRALCTLALSAALALPATAADAAPTSQARPTALAARHHPTLPGADDVPASRATRAPSGTTAHAPSGESTDADGRAGAADQWPGRLPAHELPTGLLPFPTGAPAGMHSQGHRGPVTEPGRAAAEAERLGQAARRKGEQRANTAQEAAHGVAPRHEPSTARPPASPHARTSLTQRPPGPEHSTPGRSAAHPPAGKPAPERNGSPQRRGPAPPAGNEPGSPTQRPGSPWAKPPREAPSEQALPYPDEGAAIPPAGTRASAGRESLVLPLGAGFTMIGLGLGFLGYRLRRG